LQYKVYCTFPFSYGPAACGTIHQASFGLGYVCAYQALSNCQEGRRTGPCVCCSKSKTTSFGEWFSSEACLCGTLARMPSLNHGKTMKDLSSRNTFFYCSLWSIFKWGHSHFCFFMRASLRIFGVAYRCVECIATRSCQVEETFFRPPNVTRMLNWRWMVDGGIGYCMVFLVVSKYWESADIEKHIWASEAWTIDTRRAFHFQRHRLSESIFKHQDPRSAKPTKAEGLCSLGLLVGTWASDGAMATDEQVQLGTWSAGTAFKQEGTVQKQAIRIVLMWPN